MTFQNYKEMHIAKWLDGEFTTNDLEARIFLEYDGEMRIKK